MKDRYTKHIATCSKIEHQKIKRTASKSELLEWLKIDKNQYSKSDENIEIDKSLEKQMRLLFFNEYIELKRLYLKIKNKLELFKSKPDVYY